ncbi:MAG: ATP-binding protein [Dehalococcoidales bacterium]|nr:ATP-binding protein [Dehalococcoidales bacterium]
MGDEEEIGAEMILEDGEDTPASLHDPIKRHEMLGRKNHDAINKFLGEGPRSVEAYSTKWYYTALLVWTVKRITTSPGWKTVSHHGYSLAEPVFRDIPTDYIKSESCMVDGQILVEKEDIRLVITVNAMQRAANAIQIEAGAERMEEIKILVQDIAAFLKEHNFYRGKKISFELGISFLNAGQRDWDSVILDPAMKKEIRLNTIGFLKNCTRLEKYGVPPKRGIILAGEPGTGKTIVCKALMSEADNITCITTAAYGMLHERYISDLFSIAQDLSPSMVFMEDMDLIGQERHDFYPGTPPLIALLAEMDGIAEKTAIVTVATSNCFETLDKALSERPSRFDRVFRITRPAYQQRAELVKHISEKIPLSEDVREYIVQKTDGFTPAQLQEVLHGMVIAHIAMEEETMQFNRSDVDATIALLNMRKNGAIGFNAIPYRYAKDSTEQNRRKEEPES